MELFLINNDYKYAVEQIMLMLFPGESPVYPEKSGDGLRAVVKMNDGESFVTATCTIDANGLMTVTNEQATLWLVRANPDPTAE